ncbi:glycoside hydrolase superfamily [Mycena rosella]|uniref:Glycoside hydrolase superfamily n=1 Tax=Mycena rosella TaxID=1033263 RepID=A0AAD7CZ72_MYCRO|nr:glycoside hydrolase superfamily [Mycena rosella]
MYGLTFSLLICAQFLARTSASAAPHIRRSPKETSPGDDNPGAANATDDSDVDAVIAAAQRYCFGELRRANARTNGSPTVFVVANVLPLLAIGGWTGSQYFSPAVASENRTQFVDSVLGLVTKYGLDGNDFDCNAVAANDSVNFLAFLQQLQQENSTLLLTATVGTEPFMGGDGNPMADVSAFAKVLNRIELMVYDTWNPNKTAGAKAPLTDCAPHQFGSVTSAVAAWTAAKFPVEQPAGPSDVAGDTTPDQCGNPTSVSGVYTFAQLVSAGFLDVNGQALHNYLFDTCTSTNVLVSYDDANSFAAKGNFIADNGLAGFAMWEVTSGDYNDILVDSLYTAMGTEYCQ